MRAGPSWRASGLARLADETFDVLVVGGGATGAAIARDASLRGLMVALCEYGDFACQTSSQSSKLLHGGLRYLQYGDLGLVFEGLAERHRFARTASHLCRPVEFLFPAYRGHKPSLPALGIGIMLYDALALWRPPAKSRRLSSREIYQLAPYLRSAGLLGAELYVDCQTDDARLVLENILDAESAGAVCVSYVEVRPPRPGPRNPVRKIEVLDRETGDTFAVRARAVVNATGPFSDAFSGGPRLLRPTLGVHMVVDAARLPTSGRAIVVQSPRDGRLMFTLPAGSRMLFGTTDTDWPTPSGSDRAPSPQDCVTARGVDVAYLLEAANFAFPSAALEPQDVISTFAGLRPLIATEGHSPSATSREHEIWLDRQGTLTVSGGKLTTMRKMAEETVDQLAELLASRGVQRQLARCTTRTRPLPGGVAPADLDGFELAGDVKTRLQHAYGARARQVAALAASSEAMARRIVPGLPYLRAEILFAARADRACEIEDVLRRRIPLFRDAHDQGLATAEDAADLLADELGWSPARRAHSLDSYRRAVAVSRRWRESYA